MNIRTNTGKLDNLNYPTTGLNYIINPGQIKFEGTFWFDELYNVPLASDKITGILGNVKGVVSTEDRQLLKIALNLSDKDVDKLISNYKIEYNNHVKSSRPWGKEKWR